MGVRDAFTFATGNSDSSELFFESNALVLCLVFLTRLCFLGFGKSHVCPCVKFSDGQTGRQCFSQLRMLHWENDIETQTRALCCGNSHSSDVVH